MVKNTGGNKAKGFARKNEKSNQPNKLRMSECPEEKYAIVRKIYGGSLCEIFCDDLKTRQGVIRGKFRGGKGKRNNIINAGTIVLIGTREWATEPTNGKLEQADILEVYSLIELDQLKQKPTFPTDFLESSMREMFGNSTAGEKNDEFIFSTIEEETTETNIKTPETFITIDNGEMINVDDI
jgi:translation initiation factor IF-1